MNLERPQAPDPYDLMPRVPTFTLESTGFTDGSPLPEEQAYEGGNTSPELHWSGAPEGTRSFLVTCFDPDAPTPSGFWHWSVVGLPADVTSLEGGAGSGAESLPSGAFALRNDYGTNDFGGAAPPAGDVAHRYVFAVHALDAMPEGIDGETSPAKASFMTLRHVIGRATLTGTYRL